MNATPSQQNEQEKAAQDLANRLCSAAKDSSLEQLRELLRAGVSPDARDEMGYTPLVCAAKNDQAKAVQVLLDHGADPNLADAHGVLPLIAAFEDQGRNKCTRVLMGCDRLNLFQKDAKGFSYLHHAIMNDQVSVARSLINIGLDVNEESPEGHNAIFLAYIVCPGREELIKFIAEKGARFDAVHKKSGSALTHIAVMTSSTSMFEFALRHGAPVDFAKSDGVTPIFDACRFGHADKVMLLLKHGADPAGKVGQRNLYEAAKEAGGVAWIQIALMLKAYGAPDGPGMSSASQRYDMLQAAVAAGLKERSLELIESGHPVTQAQDSKLHPLNLAKQYGDELVSVLSSALARQKIKTILSQAGRAGAPQP